jgi:hypothetical protein
MARLVCDLHLQGQLLQYEPTFEEVAMNMHVGNKLVGAFPAIMFRKKRINIAIHAHFDLESADDAEQLRNRIHDAMLHLSEGGDAKIGYTVADV